MAIRKESVTQIVDVRYCDFCPDVIPGQSYERCSECGKDLCPKHYNQLLMQNDYERAEDGWVLCPECKPKVQVKEDVEHYFYPIYKDTKKVLELKFQ